MPMNDVTGISVVDYEKEPIVPPFVPGPTTPGEHKKAVDGYCEVIVLSKPRLARRQPTAWVS